jgi:hypothetical protein
MKTVKTNGYTYYYIWVLVVELLAIDFAGSCLGAKDNQD